MSSEENNGFEYDFTPLRGAIPSEQLAEIWSKAEIAKILMNRATALAEEVKNDIDFYLMVNRIGEE